MSEKTRRMDSQSKRIFYRLIMDALLMLSAGLPLLYYTIFGKSNLRGFRCDDESIQYKYMESTVRSWMLYFIGLVIPLGIVLLVEFSVFQRNKPLVKYFNFKNYKIPIWLFDCYKVLATFAFGMLMCQLVVDITKYSIGRLRPHFLDVCQPIFADGTTCDDAINIGRYIEEYTCQGVNFSKRLLKEATLSFPSGHSSFTFFVMIFMIIYLQKRMILHFSILGCRLLQISFILIALFTASSRVYDFKHHLSDVLMGSFIGTIFAFISSYALHKKLFNWSTVLEMNETPRKSQKENFK